jgi:hypothetical protein
LVVYKVLSGERPPRPSEADCILDMTDDMWFLIDSCWAQDRHWRPSMPDVRAMLLDIFRPSPFQ